MKIQDLQFCRAVTDPRDRIKFAAERLLHHAGSLEQVLEEPLKSKFGTVATRMVTLLAGMDRTTVHDAGAIVCHAIDTLDENLMDQPREEFRTMRGEINSMILSLVSNDDVADVQKLLAESIEKAKVLLKSPAQSTQQKTPFLC